MSDAELSGHAAGLVLNHVRHEVWAQLHVGPSVAAHVVVVGGGEQSEDLSGGGGDQESVTSKYNILYRILQKHPISKLRRGVSPPCGCGRTRSPPACTRASG